MLGPLIKQRIFAVTFKPFIALCLFGLIAACGSPDNSPSANTQPAINLAHSTLQAKPRLGVVVKIGGIPWFSDRGTPGYGNVPWDVIYAALAAINYKGALAMESFINMQPQLAYGLAVWRPVAASRDEVLDNGLPFLRNKAKQYGLI